MIDQIEQLAGAFQNLLSARTAVLLRRYRSQEVMQRGPRIVLCPQLEANPQRDDLHP